MKETSRTLPRRTGKIYMSTRHVLFGSVIQFLQPFRLHQIALALVDTIPPSTERKKERTAKDTA